MHIDPAALELDKCYRTESGEVRLVMKIDEEDITYCSRGPRHFLDWHATAAQKSLPREVFAEEATREVPFFWEPEPNRALA
jgi:hypothetical protein